MKRLSLLLVVFGVLSIPGLFAADAVPDRGRSQILGVDVRLETEHGKQVSVPFEDLSAAEREAVVRLLTQSAEPEEQVWTGKVVRITDGDTFLFQDEHDQQHVVRLSDIDTPESDQACGKQAAEYLRKKILGKTVTVKWKERCKYGRILGHVYVGDDYLNADLLRNGLAWFYVEYSTRDDFRQLEKVARQAKRDRSLFHSDRTASF